MVSYCKDRTILVIVLVILSIRNHSCFFEKPKSDLRVYMITDAVDSCEQPKNKNVLQKMNALIGIV
jgi:hypothetical protein